MLLVALLPFQLTGCFFFSRPPVLAPLPAPTVTFDVGVLGKDATGLAAASERLCSTLTTHDQKLLGFSLAQRALAMSPHHTGAAIAVAHCAAVLTEWETDAARLETIAQVGLEAGKAAGAPDRDPRASYWMAVNLGLAIQQRGMAALPLLPVEMAALKTSQAAKEIELGGPLRALGMLYLKAPSWPAGPGDLDAAMELLKEAVDTYPSHPLNHLFYAQALRESGDGGGASKELARAQELARPELWGEYAALWRAQIQAAAK
ncbi:MAG: tetratricopeptide repeat protein [Myxococcales bacterium]